MSQLAECILVQQYPTCTCRCLAHLGLGLGGGLLGGEGATYHGQL